MHCHLLPPYPFETLRRPSVFAPRILKRFASAAGFPQRIAFEIDIILKGSVNVKSNVIAVI
jgi:hypothetical protein